MNKECTPYIRVSLTLYVCFFLFLTLALPVLVGCSPKSDPQTSQQNDSAAADSAGNTFKQVSGKLITLQDSYLVRREFIGALQAPQRVELSFDASGAIQDIFVKEGDIVEQGQVLATLDNDVLRAELKAAEASRRDLKSRAAFNDRELARLNKLRNNNFASESRYDEIETQKQSLLAQIDGVSATIRSLEKRLDRMVMKAPFAANVSARFLDDGSIVNTGSPVLQLLESDELLVRLGMPVPLARNLHVGQQLSAIVEGSEYLTEIQSIGLSVSFTTNTVPVELKLITEKESARLYDGQIVRLVVPENRDVQGTWVPVESLVAGVRGSWDVYVLARNNFSQTDKEETNAEQTYNVERRKVNVEYVGDGKAFVSHGLKNNDYLVDKGVQKIATGQTVTLLQHATLASF